MMKAPLHAVGQQQRTPCQTVFVAPNANTPATTATSLVTPIKVNHNNNNSIIMADTDGDTSPVPSPQNAFGRANTATNTNCMFNPNLSSSHPSSFHPNNNNHNSNYPPSSLHSSASESVHTNGTLASHRYTTIVGVAPTGGGGGGGGLRSGATSNVRSSAARGGAGVQSGVNSMSFPSVERHILGTANTSTTLSTGRKVSTRGVVASGAQIAIADGDEESGAGEAKARRCRFKVNLAGAAGYQCIMAVVIIFVIVLVTDRLVSDMTKSMVREEVTAELTLTRLEIHDPLARTETWLSELRDTFSGIRSMRGHEVCSMSSANFSASADFYLEAHLGVKSNELLDNMYYIKRNPLNAVDPATGYYATSMCMASDRSLRSTQPNDIRRSARPPRISEFEDLDAIGYTVDGGVGTLFDKAAFGFTLSWDTLFAFDPRSPVPVLYLLAGIPVEMNETTVATGVTRELFLDSTTGDPNITDPKLHHSVVAGMGVNINIQDFAPSLRRVTPTRDGAHTTLYDLTDSFLLTSSAAEGVATDFVTFDRANGKMWSSGESSSASINDAFNTFDLETFVHGETRVDLGRDTVVSALVFDVAGGRRFAVVQSVPRAHYFGKHSQLRTILIVVGTLGAVLIAALCGLIGFVGIRIRRGVQAVLDNMDLAAAMRNDRVLPVTSALWEVEMLARGFEKMNNKLLDARAFMPQHMLVSATDDSDDNEEEGDVVTLSSSKPVSHHNHNKKTTSENGYVVYHESGTDYTASNTHTGTAVNTQHTGGGAAQNSNKVSSGAGGLGGAGASLVHVKRVTILAINTRSFHKCINVLSPSTVVQPTRELTELVNALALREKGVIDSFHGDHFVLSFNAARGNAEGPLKAVRCAAELMTIGPAIGRRFSMGVSVGRAAVGHLGTATLKRLSIIGPVYAKALALENICSRFNDYHAAMAKRHEVVLLKGVLGVDGGGGEGNLAAAGPAGSMDAEGGQSSRRHSAAGVVVHTTSDGDAAPLARTSVDLSGAAAGASSPVLDCMMDAPMMVEVQHSCVVQLVGGVRGAPFSDKQQQQQPQQSAPSSPPLPSFAYAELIYALRTASEQQQQQHGGDEWLYEITSPTNGTVTAINNALMAYLKGIQLPCAPAGGGGTGRGVSNKQSAEGVLAAASELRRVLSELDGGCKQQTSNFEPLGSLPITLQTNFSGSDCNIMKRLCGGDGKPSELFDPVVYSVYKYAILVAEEATRRATNAMSMLAGAATVGWANGIDDGHQLMVRSAGLFTL